MSLSRLFDRLAGHYDRFNRAASLGLDGYWRKRSLGLVGRDGPVLDLGTGSGEILLGLGSRRKGVGPLVGADVSPVMLSLARAKARRRCPTDGPIFIRADGRKLPFRENSFTACLTAFTVRNLQDELPAVFRQVLRVLAPGGRFVVLEMGMPENRMVRAAYGLYLRRVMPLIGRYYAGERGSFDYLRRTIERFPARDEVSRALTEAGFSGVRVKELSLGLARIFVGRKGGR